MKRTVQWSGPRDKIAELILELRKNGAGVIVMSVSFSEPGRFGKDFEFVSMLQNNGVVIAQTGSIQKSKKVYPLVLVW